MQESEPDDMDDTDELRCADCGGDHRARRQITPTGSEAVLCIGCFAERIEEQTTLSGREAEVFAWDSTGATLPQIAEQTDMETRNVRKYLRRAQEKFEAAVDQWQEADRTLVMAEYHEKMYDVDAVKDQQ